ncbi:uncharacterized protein [Watersipora subatra]|uniref:uncharacterized protein n=1 Tax=Watersipora subatra TaxID=2589382 RepID=UPI00355AEB10
MTDVGKNGKETQISLTEMKLLITAVISFDPQQIVSAFLDVERLRDSLLNQLGKTSIASDSGQSVSLADQMQSAFLRPDTPLQTNVFQHSITTDDKTEQSSYIHSLPDNKDLQASPILDSMHNDTEIPAAIAKTMLPALPSHHSSTSINTEPPVTSVTTVASSTSGDPLTTVHSATCGKSCDQETPVTADNGLSVAAVDSEISSNSVTPVSLMQPLNIIRSANLTSINNSLSKKSSRLDKMLRNHLTTNSSTHSDSKRRHELCTQQVHDAVEQSSVIPRQRKRKSAAPRYNPYQPVYQPVAQCDDSISDSSHNVSSKIAMLLDNQSSNAQHSSASGVILNSTCSDLTRPQPAASLVESLNANVELMAAADRLLPPCGPFVTHSQSELRPTHPHNADLDYQLSAIGYTDNIELPSLMLEESGLTDVSLFSEVTQDRTCLLESKKVKTKAKKGRPSNLSKIKTDNVLDLSTTFKSECETKSDSALLRLRCRRCSERFTSKSDYQLHLKSQICSTGFTQTYTCQACGYCALTRQRLIVHMRTHSGERPHRCPFCSYAATQQAPLKRHMQNIHLKAGAVSLTAAKHPSNPPLAS